MRCLDDLEIISQYNSEIMGFYNFYSIANNSPVIDSFYNIMEYSMYKTYAAKYSTSKKENHCEVQEKRSICHTVHQ